MPAIIWQIFDMKDIKSPETKMRPNYWELLGKTRETITSELILWRILTFWNHCVPQCLFPAIPSYPISTHLIFVNFKGGCGLTTQQNRAAAATTAAYIETAQDIIRNRLYLIVPRFFCWNWVSYIFFSSYLASRDLEQPFCISYKMFVERKKDWTRGSPS